MFLEHVTNLAVPLCPHLVFSLETVLSVVTGIPRGQAVVVTRASLGVGVHRVALDLPLFTLCLFGAKIEYIYIYDNKM